LEHLTFAKMIEAGDSKVTQIFHNTKLLPTERLRGVFQKYDDDHNGGLDLDEATAALEVRRSRVKLSMKKMRKRLLTFTQLRCRIWA
jgi:Ca2+-binding EF-hand superfamily protein